LERIAAYATGGTGNEYGFAWLQPPGLFEHLKGCDTSDDERAGDVETEMRLEWNHVDNIGQRKLCVSPKTVTAEQRKYPVAAPKSCYVLATSSM
jgi:hypothetical protein